MSLLKNVIISLLYYGKNHYCPCCDRWFRKFKATGTPRRENVLCPLCYSFERHRFLSLFLKKNIDLFFSNSTLLHVAPEPCLRNIFSINKIKTVSIDIKQFENGITADLAHLPFRSNIFSAVICNHVLEHINSDIMGMKEIHRILMLEGWAIIQVPLDRKLKKTFENPEYNTPELRQKYFGQDDHVRLYGMDYFDRLRSIGFSVEDIIPCSFLSDMEIDRYRIDHEDSIPLVHK